MRNGLLKKVVGFGLAAVMSMSMAVSAFAGTDDAAEANTGNVQVEFAIAPAGLAAQEQPDKKLPPTGYTLNTGNIMYESKAFPVDISSVLNCPATDVPAGFAGDFPLEGTATAFNAIYKAATNAAPAGLGMTVGSDFIYGYDTVSVPNGIYYTAISGLATKETDSHYSNVEGESYWKGYSWSFYKVPSTEKNFNTAAPNKNYESALYTNNIELEDGYTYYMIYQFNETTW